MTAYNINKGIGREVEFHGLKAQYLFYFCLLYTSPSPRD